MFFILSTILAQMAYNVPAVYENRDFAGLSHCEYLPIPSISISYNELALLVRGCILQGKMMRIQKRHHISKKTVL
jgi:hypothetical protein